MKLKKKAKTGAVVYCRVSTIEQGLNLSLEVQEQKCRALCAKQQWSVEKVFLDMESAKTTNRPGFQEMLSYCILNSNKIHAVVVYDTTRFSRNTSDALMTEAALGAKKIVVRSCTQEFDETPHGKFNKTLMYALGNLDNDVKSEKTKEGMKLSIQKGLWMHRAPLGYVNVPRVASQNWNIAPDPERAPLIRKAFELYSSGSFQKNEVLATVTTLGLRSAMGLEVSPQSFDRILRNPIYAGKICSTWGIVAQGTFEPLVTEEMFERVQEVLQGKASKASKPGTLTRDFPLRGLLHCGACGTPLTGSVSSGNGGKYAYYFCRKPTCRKVKVRRELLESKFSSFMHALRPKAEFWPMFTAVLEKVSRQKRAARVTTKELVGTRLASLRSRRQRLINAMIDGKLKAEVFQEQIDLADEEIRKLELEVEETSSEEQEVSQLIDFAKVVLGGHQSFLWENADFEKKLRIQRAYFPSGLTVQGDEFGTTEFFSFFNSLEQNMDDEKEMASPAGFEPALSP
jgi:site-specific DNA recombinase